MRHRWAWLGGLLACGLGCSADGSAPGGALRQPAAGGAAVAPEGARDLDGDGLCNPTERDYGTDPEQADTDADGLPDLVEIANSFDPVSSTSPAEDQVGLLEARHGATLELPVRTTVDGDGQALTGSFSPATAVLLDHTHDITDFFVSATVVSADPIDNVRGVDYESERFSFVAGETRLGFSLLFEYPFEEGLDCAEAYPFRYELKNDGGDTVAARRFLVVVAPEGAGELGYCEPSTCY